MEHFTIIGVVVIIVCALFSYWKRLGEREEECVPPVEGNYSALAGADNTSEKSDDVETENVNMGLVKKFHITNNLLMNLLVSNDTMKLKRC